MRANFEKGCPEFSAITDFWHFMRDHWITETTDEYWSGVVKSADSLAEKYKNTSADLLSSTLAIAGCTILEKKSKKEHKEYKVPKTKQELLWLQVYYAYRDFLSGADEEDKKILEDMLKKYEDKAETKLIRGAMLHEN